MVILALLVVQTRGSGVVRTLKPGTTTVFLYSWEDARPLATNAETTFLRGGLQDSIVVTVQ